MTPEQWARQTAVAQGLPPKITDPATLALIARAVLDQLARADSASTMKNDPPKGAVEPGKRHG